VTAAAPAAPALESPSIKRQALLSLGLALAVGTAILLLPALEPVRDRFAGTNGFWVAAALGLQVLSTLSFVVAFRGAFERRIGWRAAFDLSMVEEGTNVILPSGGSGGLAVGAVLLIRAGVPTRFAVSRSGVLFLATSAVSLLALCIAGTAEAIGLLPGDAPLAITLGPALGAALVMVGAVVLSHRIPEIGARPDQRLRSLARRAQRFIREAVDISIAMIRGGDALLIGGSVGYFAFDVASLGASFEALGGGALPVGLFVLAYVLGHGGAIIPIPGSAEGGLVGAFTLYGSPLSLAVGAILVYRTFHAGVPMTLAIVGLADIHRLRREGPAPEEIAKSFDDEGSLDR
jgi:uncharacterized membrane protein YbhN (UPF0104 family)